ncbi:MAG: tRNA threonylcarbamoyladenosine biosynthesis protein TsaE [Clostridia bacterium]|nr:tRNA threonylcarbamoyladenosine biosynthesis protein TsaE [Clostridia bacterium]MDN5322786.1 tRNA threonylcarbamoyladenosine biosynthesis protein TsaE [Clostridia bacterium]
MVCLITKNPEETEYIGQRMAKFLRPGDFISLNGELGAGKTVFVKGVAKGMGVEENITSPTFTIIHEYHDGRLPIYHLDVYRLNSINEMEELGYEEYFYGKGITLVEWGNLIVDIFPSEFLVLEFKQNPEGREICFYPRGEHYERLVEELTGYDYTKHR